MCLYLTSSLTFFHGDPSNMTSIDTQLISALRGFLEYNFQLQEGAMSHPKVSSTIQVVGDCPASSSLGLRCPISSSEDLIVVRRQQESKRYAVDKEWEDVDPDTSRNLAQRLVTPSQRVVMLSSSQPQVMAIFFQFFLIETRQFVALAGPSALYHVELKPIKSALYLANQPNVTPVLKRVYHNSFDIIDEWMDDEVLQDESDSEDENDSDDESGDGSDDDDSNDDGDGDGEDEEEKRERDEDRSGSEEDGKVKDKANSKEEEGMGHQPCVKEGWSEVEGVPVWKKGELVIVFPALPLQQVRSVCESEEANDLYHKVRSSYGEQGNICMPSP